MRKMKKINGFLVVRFNDREKAGYPTLGNFGVIDAEYYTGSIDIDRDAFEYDDADTIEVAVEQARGLNAEEDFADEPPVYTVVVETADEVKEEEIEPQLLINGWERQLETQVKSSHYKDVDPRTAAHELYGYKVALCDLGLIDREDRAVDPDHFAPGMTEQPLPKSAEELLSHICDEVCRHPRANIPSDELEAICERCKVEQLENEAYDREARIKEKAKERLDGLIQGIAGTQLTTKAELLKCEAQAYLEALTTTKTLTEREIIAYGSAIEEAVKLRPALPEKEIFANLHGNRKAKSIYTLGLALAEACPDNDCKVYLNIFNMARELDAALDEIEGYPAEIISLELIKHVRELGRMYHSNYAIQRFKEGMQS